MFMTALGKLMALFPGGGKKKKKKKWEAQRTTRTRAFGCSGEKGKVGSGLLAFSFFSYITT